MRDGVSVCLPLSIYPCTIKSRSSLLALAHPGGGPGKRAVKRLCWWLWCISVRKCTASVCVKVAWHVLPSRRLAVFIMCPLMCVSQTVSVLLLSHGVQRLLQAVIEQGGIQPGGLNFDAKVRRESVDVADLFIAHIGLSVTALSALNLTGFVRAPGIVVFFCRNIRPVRAPGQ